MRKRFFLLIAIFAMAVGVQLAVSISASAETEGIYTYKIANGEATITDCDESASGAIDIPSTLGGYPVTKIGMRAFSGCNSIRHITIPNSVTTIGEYAFSKCTGIENITIPNSVTTIGEYAFLGCTSSKSITISNSVTTIEQYTFSGCSSVESVTIPNGVTSIGSDAFSACEALIEATIPTSVTSIASGVFYECSSLKRINVDPRNADYSSVDGVLFNKDKTELLQYASGKTDQSYEVPNGVISIGRDSFTFCNNLTSVSIPHSVTSIGYNAFWECNTLERIYLPVMFKGQSIGSNDVLKIYICQVDYMLDGVTIMTESVTEGDNTALPTAPDGYRYRFTVNGAEWKGENITENVTVTVTKVCIITYEGDYSGVEEVDSGNDAALPAAPGGYSYQFTVNGNEWNGQNVTESATVTVTQRSDENLLFSINNIENAKINDEIVRGETYNRHIILQIDVSEKAQYQVFADLSCTKEVNELTLELGVNIFYVKVTSESGKERVYTVALTRNRMPYLGELKQLQVSGDFVMLEIENTILGDAAVEGYYSYDNIAWTRIDAVYYKQISCASISGLDKGTYYYLKIAADYGDYSVESDFVYVRAGGQSPSECYILEMIDPPGGIIDNTNSMVSGLRVNNSVDTIEVQARVSDNATWALYRTESAQTPVEKNRLELREGYTTTAYIRVLAQDGYTTRQYQISIYRQTKSALPQLSYENGFVKITAASGSTIIYTTDSTEPILSVDGVEYINGINYTAPIKVEDGMVIKAVVKNLDKDEYSDTAVYHVDKPAEITIDEVYFDNISDTTDYEWSFYLSNSENTGLRGTFYVAAYDAANRLVGIQSIDVKTDESEIELKATLHSSEKAARYKAFFWDSDLTPLAISSGNDI